MLSPAQTIAITRPCGVQNRRPGAQRLMVACKAAEDKRRPQGSLGDLKPLKQGDAGRPVLDTREKKSREEEMRLVALRHRRELRNLLGFDRDCYSSDEEDA